MSKGDNSPGINRLARAIRQVTGAGEKAEQQLDFGVIQQNGSLLTNSFPVPIPRDEYHVCRQLRQYWGTYGDYSFKTNDHLEKGDRVLVAWVGSEAVVIDVIIKASRIIW